MSENGAPPPVHWDEFLRLRAGAVDDITGLSAYIHSLDAVRRMSDGGEEIGVLVLHMSPLQHMEDRAGWETYDRVLAATAAALADFSARRLGGQALVTQKAVHDDNFVMFVAPGAIAPHGTLDDLAGAMLVQVRSHVVGSLGDHVELPVMLAGYSVVTQRVTQRFERSLHRAVAEAEIMAVHAREADQMRRSIELRRILTRRELGAAYQPIVDMRSGHVVAYEALARGPAGTPFERPDELFTVGLHANMEAELDLLCRVAAVRPCKNRLGRRMLFLNTLPRVFTGEDLAGGPFREALDEAGLAPNQVVIEINERQSISDFDAFVGSLGELVAEGFRIALDDVGTGYSSLKAISEIRPHFLKIDMGLVRGVHQNLIKQELVATLADLARKTRSRLIAEGIETPAEYEYLRDQGVELGQGFLFGRPGPDLVDSIAL